MLLLPEVPHDWMRQGPPLASTDSLRKTLPSATALRGPHRRLPAPDEHADGALQTRQADVLTSQDLGFFRNYVLSPPAQTYVSSTCTDWPLESFRNV